MAMGTLDESAQAATTKYHSLGDFNNRHITVPETRSLRMGCHHGWVPVRTFGGLQRAALPLCAHMGERVGQGEGERARERLHSHDLI